MTDYSYQKICQDLIFDLSKRQKDIILRRFALLHEDLDKRETLEEIGNDAGITRERVRQIEKSGIDKIKSKIEAYQSVFQGFNDYFKKFGNVRKEALVLFELGGEKFRPHVYFLLSVGGNFKRFAENEKIFPLWAISESSLEGAKKALDTLEKKLEEIKKPLSFAEISALVSVEKSVLESYLEISKRIQKNAEGFFGLKDWPEINPRGVRDKAYMVFKRGKKPLHFREVAELIENSLVQTVHNELIKDARFVLIGRGTYALAEWGYEPGQVKNIIVKILEGEQKPLTKEEILDKVLKQRMVKENTVLLNLSNKKYFSKDSQGRYIVKADII